MLRVLPASAVGVASRQCFSFFRPTWISLSAYDHCPVCCASVPVVAASDRCHPLAECVHVHVLVVRVPGRLFQADGVPHSHPGVLERRWYVQRLQKPHPQTVVSVACVAAGPWARPCSCDFVQIMPIVAWRLWVVSFASLAVSLLAWASTYVRPCPRCRTTPASGATLLLHPPKRPCLPNFAILPSALSCLGGTGCNRSGWLGCLVAWHADRDPQRR